MLKLLSYTRVSAKRQSTYRWKASLSASGVRRDDLHIHRDASGTRVSRTQSNHGPTYIWSVVGRQNCSPGIHLVELLKVRCHEAPSSRRENQGWRIGHACPRHRFLWATPGGKLAAYIGSDGDPGSFPHGSCWPRR